MRAAIIAFAVAVITLFSLADSAYSMEKRQREPCPFKVGDEFPDFELPNLAGVATKTGDIKMGKALIVRFRMPPSDHPMFRHFAELDINEMNMIQEKYLGKAAVVDVVVKNPKKLEELIEEYEQKRVAYNVLVDQDGALADKLKIKAPYILVIRAGKILGIFQHLGVRNYEEQLDKLIEP